METFSMKVFSDSIFRSTRIVIQVLLLGDFELGNDEWENNRGCPLETASIYHGINISRTDPINRIWMIRSQDRSDSLPGRSHCAMRILRKQLHRQQFHQECISSVHGPHRLSSC